jgi:HTH-type transcriptional regulator, sugar sensing transcriptional regulator
MKQSIKHGHEAIRPLLQRAGLDEKEVEVYLAILSLKMAKASQVAKVAKQSRSHTYLMLRSLEEKGLVSEAVRGDVLHFIAEQPQRLVSYLQDRKQELSQVQELVEGALPMLSSLTKPLVSQPRVTTLHGLDGMKQVYRDVLTQEFSIFFNAEKMFETFGSNVVTMLFGKQSNLRGRELFVDNEGAKRYLKEIPLDEQYDIRLLPKEISFASEFVIFEETVALFAYDDDLTIIKIENKNIADAFRSWFDYLWTISRLASNKKAQALA